MINEGFASILLWAMLVIVSVIVVLCCLYILAELVLWRYYKRKERFFKSVREIDDDLINKE